MIGLSASGLRMSYPGHDLLSDIDLAVRPGEVVGLFGRSGSGKSTIFKILIGALSPQAGEVRLDGRSLKHLPVDARARLGLGYVPQSPALFLRMTVLQNLMVAAEASEPDRRRRAALLGLLCRQQGLEELASTPVASLSGGERKRCEIAYAMAARPRILLLDEPLAGLDPIAAQRLGELLRQLAASDVGILVTDHRLRDVLPFVDRSYRLEAGAITEVRPAPAPAPAPAPRARLHPAFGIPPVL